ncbi:Potassium channel subfamily K member 18 [Strongyloides ratti]|uniref:Potassium channel subfamily K member 18 n=1 Tax=Strongyloides ratti TaxID=34506 RepID=A0A090LP60_STRRB|nr:Potassium channel subfamily K member 18 [Strongyloides ratti]CEF69984.1 Potassium channel subfamily K member 18 [Strongyloides ratti]
MQSTYLMFKRPSTTASRELAVENISRRSSVARRESDRSGRKSVEELSADRLNQYLDGGKGTNESHGIFEQIVDGVNEKNRPPTTFPKIPEPTTKERWKKRLRIIFPHVGLVFLSCAYTLIGASIFHYYEMPYEIRIRNETSQRINTLKMNIINELWSMVQEQENITLRNFDSFSSYAHQGMNNVIKDVFVDYTKNYMTPDDIINGTGPIKWTFGSSIFFSWTAITTIGYGHIVPRTNQGRIACLLYALIGIPLILVTIADMGRFLSGGIIFLYNFLRKLFYRTIRKIYKCFRLIFCCKSCRYICKRTRSKNTDVPKSLEDDSNNRDNHNNNRRQSGITNLKKKPNGGILANTNRIPTIIEDDAISESGTLGDVSEIQTVDDSDASIDQEGKGKKSTSFEDDPSSNEEDYKISDHERRVSVLFILIIMLCYTAGGACLIQCWEDWDFMEAFYFCFVTVTTIGFGDIVPHNADFLPLTLAYIIFGLIITTMCIDLVGSEYIKDIHFYGRSIGRSFLTIGGKVVHLSEVFSYVAFLQKNFGLTPEQLDRLAQLPEEYLLDCLVNGKQPDVKWIGGRPFIPQDIYYFKWIEQPRTLSFVSERVLASMESLDLNTSRCSTARTLTPKEYYQKILVHYCRQMQPPDTGNDIPNIDAKKGL